MSPVSPEHPESSELGLDAPNESAPGHEIPEPPDSAEPGDAPQFPAPNESAPGHRPDPADGD